MKILRPLCALTAEDRVPSVEIFADSAWRPHRRPLFVPEDADTLPRRCSIVVAVRMSRLGKAVKAKFAHRYYDAVALVCHTVPSDTAEAAREYYRCADDALVHGEWIETVPDGLPATATLNGTTVATGLDAETIGQAIENLSRSMTFKTGDVLLLPGELFGFVPERGMTVKAALGPEDAALVFNIR